MISLFYFAILLNFSIKMFLSTTSHFITILDREYVIEQYITRLSSLLHLLKQNILGSGFYMYTNITNGP